MTKKLYVGNLSCDTTEETLFNFFSRVGEVISASIVTDRMSGRSRGFGFVEMAEESTAQEAINQLDGRKLDGQSLEVTEARPRQPYSDWLAIKRRS